MQSNLAELEVALDRAPAPNLRAIDEANARANARAQEQAALRAEKDVLNARLRMGLIPSGRTKEQPVTSIPILPFIWLDPAFVTLLQFKFNLGRNPKNLPKGVREFVPTMSAEERMKHNIERATEKLGPEAGEEKRLGNRKHDTALGLLGGSKVFDIAITAMLDLHKVGYKLRDVNIGKNSKHEFELRFTYTLEAFADGDFKHCTEARAHELEAIFASDTNMFAGIFYNDNMSVRVNVGAFMDSRPKKKLVIKDVPRSDDPADKNTVPALVVKSV